MGRVLSLDELRAERDELRRRGLRLVLTNGHFDLLHLGHVRYLQQARALGDALAVAVNSDAATTARKGPRRPIVPEAERAELLAALACVDYVVIFDALTAEGVVAALTPDVYAKGGDYAGPDAPPLPEAPIVEAAGGRVALLPLVADHSTSDLVDRVLERYSGAT
ncbi:MAG: adenylyltransferase/cytidyltransferase family protein [Chloroflexi bacterium]|nr:adenylyltransferase/cytidyltransferase family protein [Chloroflexota bacterium]